MNDTTGIINHMLPHIAVTVHVKVDFHVETTISSRQVLHAFNMKHNVCVTSRVWMDNGVKSYTHERTVPIVEQPLGLAWCEVRDNKDIKWSLFEQKIQLAYENWVADKELLS